MGNFTKRWVIIEWTRKFFQKMYSSYGFEVNLKLFWLVIIFTSDINTTYLFLVYFILKVHLYKKSSTYILQSTLLHMEKHLHVCWVDLPNIGHSSTQSTLPSASAINHAFSAVSFIFCEYFTSNMKSLLITNTICSNVISLLASS